MVKTEALIHEGCIISLEMRYKKLGGEVLYDDGAIYLKNNGLPLKEYKIIKVRDRNMYRVQILNIS